MDDATASGTRTRILHTALEMFAEQGYRSTSMRAIAERLGLTKAAIFYHFPAKSHLMAALVEPLVDDMEQAVEAAAGQADPVIRRRAVIEGLLDVYLRHRVLLQVLLFDFAVLTQDREFRRLVELTQRVQDLLVPPGASLSERVRATQMLSTLGAPVLFLPEVPAERIRAEVLAGTWSLLGAPPPVPTPAAPSGPEPAPSRRAGRPSVMDGNKAARARRMYAAGTHSVAEIAAEIGVSRATVYRHLGRTSDLF